MTVYEPRRVALPTSLDDLGLSFSMERLPGETLQEFRQRVYLESRDPSGPTQSDLIRTAGRHLNLLNRPIFRIDLVLTDGEPDAPDPYIEVTSTRLRAYSDYGAGTLDFEADLYDHADGYFLRDIYNDFAASIFFTLEVLDSDYQYLHSSNLMFSNTAGLVPGELLKQNKVNKLANPYIVDFWVSQLDMLLNVKLVYDDLTELGDFFLDSTEGVLFTRDPAKGFISYTYRRFPFDLIYQSARLVPLNDTDLQYFLYDELIADDTGEPVNVLLNSKGAEVFNQVLAIHPLGWGQ